MNPSSSTRNPVYATINTEARRWIDPSGLYTDEEYQAELCRKVQAVAGSQLSHQLCDGLAQERGNVAFEIGVRLIYRLACSGSVNERTVLAKLARSALLPLLADELTPEIGSLVILTLSRLGVDEIDMFYLDYCLHDDPPESLLALLEEHPRLSTLFERSEVLSEHPPLGLLHYLPATQVARELYGRMSFQELGPKFREIAGDSADAEVLKCLTSLAPSHDDVLPLVTVLHSHLHTLKLLHPSDLKPWSDDTVIEWFKRAISGAVDERMLERGLAISEVLAGGIGGYSVSLKELKELAEREPSETARVAVQRRLSRTKPMMPSNGDRQALERVRNAMNSFLREWGAYLGMEDLHYYAQINDYKKEVMGERVLEYTVVHSDRYDSYDEYNNPAKSTRTQRVRGVVSTVIVSFDSVRREAQSLIDKCRDKDLTSGTKRD